MKTENLHDGHRERLRRRFLAADETYTLDSNFSEHELLELLLFYSQQRVNTNETAHRLLKRQYPWCSGGSRCRTSAGSWCRTEYGAADPIGLCTDACAYSVGYPRAVGLPFDRTCGVGSGDPTDVLCGDGGRACVFDAFQCGRVSHQDGSYLRRHPNGRCAGHSALCQNGSAV